MGPSSTLTFCDYSALTSLAVSNLSMRLALASASWDDVAEQKESADSNELPESRLTGVFLRFTSSESLAGSSCLGFSSTLTSSSLFSTTLAAAAAVAALATAS